MTEETSEVLTKMIVNCETGEVTVIPLSDEELANLAKTQAAIEKTKAEHAQALAAESALKASAKAKMIAGEPLTEEEAEAIIAPKVSAIF